MIVDKNALRKDDKKDEPEEKDEDNSFGEDSPISDEDFNEIMKMLNMGKNQNNGSRKF